MYINTKKYFYAPYTVLGKFTWIFKKFNPLKGLF